MRWVCILFPQLALDAVLRQRADPEEPLALLTGPAQRRVLQTVNGAGAGAGLASRPVHDRRPGLEQGLCHAPNTTPLKSNTGSSSWPPGPIASAPRSACITRVRWCLKSSRAWGCSVPWPQFEARLRSELGELGFRHRIVAAPNPAAARVLANAYDGLVVPDDQALQHHLGQMPVDRIGLEANVATALSRMGLRTLSQVQALPGTAWRGALRPPVLKHLDTLLGERPLAAGVLSAAGPFRCAHRTQFRCAIPSGAAVSAAPLDR